MLHHIIFLVHAHVYTMVGLRIGSGLSVTGTDQALSRAEEISRTLGSDNFDLVIHSPAKETRQTAELIADFNRAEVIEVPELDPPGDAITPKQIAMLCEPMAQAVEKVILAHSQTAYWTLVVGHEDLITPMVTALIAHKTTSAAYEIINRCRPGYCEGFYLRAKNNSGVLKITKIGIIT